MRVLGIDPGLERVGYSVIQREGSSYNVLCYGLIETPKIALPDRLLLIEEQVTSLIEKYTPCSLATERLVFMVNRTSGLDVSKALGVILTCSAKKNLKWREYSPTEVKKALVGVGQAEKKQVAYMVTKILGLKETPRPDDVADALAIAICDLMHTRIASFSNQTNIKK